MKLLFYDLCIPELLKSGITIGGGACIRQYALASGLKSIGQQVGILTWKGANAYVGKQAPFDLVESYPRNRWVKITKVYFYWYRMMLKAVIAYQPDFLFVKGCSIFNGILALISKKSGVPLVYLATNDKDADDRYKEYRDFISQKAYQYSLAVVSGIVCQNQYQLNAFKNKMPNKNYLLMHNPYFHEGSLRPLLKLSDRNYIAWLGLFSDQKNLPGLLQIVKAMPFRNFKIAGEQVKKKYVNPATQEALQELQHCSNVEFVGFLSRTQVLPFLSKAYVLLNTSHFEGFSNTFLEAFAAGTPVVTRKDIDPDQLIQRNNLGKVVSVYDHSAQAIEDLIIDPAYDEIADGCRNYLLKNHNPTKISEKLVGYLNTLRQNAN